MGQKFMPEPCVTKDTHWQKLFNCYTDKNNFFFIYFSYKIKCNLKINTRNMGKSSIF